jgi:hypothetical protein
MNVLDASPWEAAGSQVDIGSNGEVVPRCHDVRREELSPAVRWTQCPESRGPGNQYGHHGAVRPAQRDVVSTRNDPAGNEV